MPNHPFTMLQYFLSHSPCQILRSAHHSDILHAEGSQSDSRDIVRHKDQCCIGRKWQNESFTIGDLLMLLVNEPISKIVLRNSGLPSFNAVVFPSLSLHWNSVFEFESSTTRTWTRWRKPAASLDLGRYILSAVCSNRARFNYC